MLNEAGLNEQQRGSCVVVIVTLVNRWNSCTQLTATHTDIKTITATTTKKREADVWVRYLKLIQNEHAFISDSQILSDYQLPFLLPLQPTHTKLSPCPPHIINLILFSMFLDLPLVLGFWNKHFLVMLTTTGFLSVSPIHCRLLMA